MQKSVTQISDDEAKMLAGIPASSSLRPRRGDPVIQIRAYRRPIGSEEASSPEDDVPVSIGELAVRLVASFRRPSCRLLAPPKDREDGASA